MCIFASCFPLFHFHFQNRLFIFISCSNLYGNPFSKSKNQMEQTPIDSHTSIVLFRSGLSLHIGVDSRACEGDWTYVIDKDAKKAFLIRDKNVMAALTGSTDLQVKICSKLDEKYPNGMPTTELFEETVLRLFKLSKVCIKESAKEFQQKFKFDLETAFSHLKSDLLVGGYDLIENRFKIYKLTIAEDWNCNMEELADVRSVLGGSGTSFMEEKRIPDCDAAGFTTEEGIAYVRGCLGHAASNDWGTGGTLHVYTITPTETFHDYWVPCDRDDITAGYSPPSRDIVTAYTKCGDIYENPRTFTPTPTPTSTPTSTPWS